MYSIYNNLVPTEFEQLLWCHFKSTLLLEPKLLYKFAVSKSYYNYMNYHWDRNLQKQKDP